MRIDAMTLFPDFIAQAAAVGVVGRAQERGLLSLHAGIPAITPVAATAGWTIARSAAGRAW